MSDLLIAIALDFADERPFSAEAERIAGTMALGRAGDVRWTATGAASLFARGGAVVRTPRIKRAAFTAAADGGYTLLAGRLFGRADLRDALGSGSAGDAAAALYAAAHMRFGEDCDRRLTGNYAAIRWFPDRRRLRIARSPTSDCPIHIWRDGTRLVAASIPRALFAAGASDAISDESLADLLLLAGPSAAGSIYASCSRVPAATIADIDPTGARLREFWSIADVPAVRFKNDADYVAAVAEQFDRSIEEHLGDISSPAVSLSGGLDSQAIAAFAVPQLAPGVKLRSYTSVPMAGWMPPDRPWRFGDESDHVRALAAMYPEIEPTFVDAADARLGERQDARSLLSSWPSYNETNAHWVDECYARAAQDGCDAVMRGDLGNTGFSYDGLTGFPDWFRRGRWVRLIRELHAHSDPRPLWRKLASRAVWPHVPHGVRRWRDRNSPWVVSPFASWSPLREDYAVASGAMERARADQPDFEGYDSRSSRKWRDNVWRSQMDGSPEVYLGYRLLHGVALPDPTSFVPLLELCAGIPDEQYLRGGVDRWLARRMLKGKVPEPVRTEARDGLQGADWPLRFVRERDSLLAEIGRMQADARLAAIFDFERMTQNLAEWDGSDSVAAHDIFRIDACVGRGISTARFVRYVEGRNAG